MKNILIKLSILPIEVKNLNGITVRYYYNGNIKTSI